MENEILQKLNKLLSQKRFKEIKVILDDHNEVDTAEYLSGLSVKDAVIIFRILDKTSFFPPTFSFISLFHLYDVSKREKVHYFKKFLSINKKAHR